MICLPAPVCPAATHLLPGLTHLLPELTHLAVTTCCPDWLTCYHLLPRLSHLLPGLTHLLITICYLDWLTNLLDCYFRLTHLLLLDWLTCYLDCLTCYWDNLYSTCPAAPRLAGHFGSSLPNCPAADWLTGCWHFRPRDLYGSWYESSDTPSGDHCIVRTYWLYCYSYTSKDNLYPYF